MAGRKVVKSWTQPLGRQRHATPETPAVCLVVQHPYIPYTSEGAVFSMKIVYEARVGIQVASKQGKPIGVGNIQRVHLAENDLVLHLRLDSTFEIAWRF